MAKLPPQPIGVAPGSSYWTDWYEKLRSFVETATSSVDWSIITGKPTTVAGYGIIDGVTTSSTLTTDQFILGNSTKIIKNLGTGLVWDSTNSLLGIGRTPTTLLDVNGALCLKEPSTINSATYTVALTDNSLRFTTTNCTLTLPTASSFTGRILYLNNITNNSVISASSNVIPIGSNTAGTAILPAMAGYNVVLQSNGTNWVTLVSSPNNSEGTWTPTISFGGGSTGLTYNRQYGVYQRIGTFVTVHFQVDLSGKGSSTGNAALGGLPFTSTSSANAILGFSPYTDRVNSAIQLVLVPSSTSFSVYNRDVSGASNTQLTDTAFNNTSFLSGSFSYKID